MRTCSHMNSTRIVGSQVEWNALQKLYKRNPSAHAAKEMSGKRNGELSSDSVTEWLFDAWGSLLLGRKRAAAATTRASKPTPAYAARHPILLAAKTVSGPLNAMPR